MSNAPRHLITTADERTWVFGRPVLFLGEWCRLYDRKAIWEGMDAEVAPPFGIDPKQRKKDFDYVQALASELLFELTDALNAFHNTKHSSRYWNILVGYWLQYYIAICFNRYFTLKEALETYEIVSTTINVGSEISLVTTDTDTFMSALRDDTWNNAFYARILRNLDTRSIMLEHINKFDGIGSKLIVKPQTVCRNGYKDRIKTLYFQLLPKLSRKNDAFIKTTYLPLREEFNLHLSLKQFPQFWPNVELKEILVNESLRLQFKLKKVSTNKFENFIRELIVELIPTCFLEGYDSLVAQAESLPWPDEPKFIFTSNSFAYDEVFKVWTAQKVEAGIPYMIGQHGNNYGTKLGSQNWVESVTPDRFISWGWINGKPSNVPAFIFQLANKPRETKSDGGLLLVEVHLEGPVYPWDNISSHGIYQEEQFRFVDALPDRIRKMLTVRLHGDWSNSRWSDVQRWKDREPSVRVEAGLSPIESLIFKNRLIVHSYDSTGLLECLASNIPTICFWKGGLDHLNQSAKPYYELLTNVSIIFQSPEAAAKHIERYWDDIDAWWRSDAVQKARRVFVEQYARTTNRPVLKLRWILLNAMKEIIS
jgi:putative transferase (TIGR04331 family)